MTHQPIPPAEIEEMKARVEAATPGPWIVEKNEKNSISGDNWMLASFGLEPDYDANKDYYYFLTTDRVPASCLTGGADVDSAFVAAARQDLPRLIAEVEALQVMNQSWQDCHDDWQRQYTELKAENKALREALEEIEVSSCYPQSEDINCNRDELLTFIRKRAEKALGQEGGK